MTKIPGSYRILYVIPILPFPPNVGMRQRIFHVGRLLQRCGVVTLAMVNRFAVNGIDFNQSAEYFGQVELFRVNHPAGAGAYAKIQRLLSKRNVRSRHGSLDSAEQNRFLKLIQDYDVVWFHRLQTADMTGIYRIANSVLDVDDFFAEKYKLEAFVTRGLIPKARLWWLYTLWRRWENDLVNRFHAICVCSQNDKDRLAQSSNAFVLPNGFEPSPAMTESPPANEPRLGFIGYIKYYPNLDGITWFINEVLPIILKQLPHVRIRIVGEPPANEMPAVHPNIDWLGFVEDAGSEMSTWNVSIVPLRIGGGTRIKILEALSRSCPVVSTATGAYGLDLEHGRHLLIADSAEEFAEHCLQMLKDRDFSRKLAEAGRQRYYQRYTWDAIQPAVESIVRKVANRDDA